MWDDSGTEYCEVCESWYDPGMVCDQCARCQYCCNCAEDDWR